ncbi:MAG: hypothetical protein VXW65_11265 [Pseudomonadota bacterium]|nr:hypothetical protein [Pseudomonadota bacterium]
MSRQSKIRNVALLGMVGLLVGCASTPPKPAYVSPTQYQGMSCQQLRSEYQRISQYLRDGIDVPKWRSTGVGIGIGGIFSGGRVGIRPSISVGMSESSNTARTEYSRLLGQREAMAQAAEFKGCPIVLKPSS